MSENSVNKTPAHTASISRLQLYGRCQTAGFLRYECGERAEKEAPHFFVGKTIHEALEAYYEGKYHSPTAAVMDILADKLALHGLTEKQIDAAFKIGKVENEILAKFSRGEITKPDGSLYTAPKMTRAYKELASKSGLYGMVKALEGVTLQGFTDERGNTHPPVDSKEDGVHALVGRIIALTKRYEDTLMIPRECFEELFVEAEFKFDEPLPNGDIFRFKGFIDLFGKLKPEFRQKHANGKSWVLRDYKTGKAKESEAHDTAADESLQLTLYAAALIREFGVPADDLDIALHYLDAAHNASTERDPEDFGVLIPLAEAYVASKGNPGLPKRLLYSENMDCKYCDIRGACEKRFGFATRSAAARAAVKEAMPLLDKLAEG